MVSVCYRYDDQQQKRLKTVESIVGEEPWTPHYEPAAWERMIALRIAVTEGAMQRKVKAVGETQNPAPGVTPAP